MHLNARSIIVASLLAAQVNADSVSLTQFQQISGFPSACAAVYDGTINGCQSSDFQNGGPCSQACVKGLNEITQELISACEGTPTSPNTLIGLFLRQKAVAALCPQIATAAASTTIGAAPTSAAAVSSRPSAAATTNSPSASSATQSTLATFSSTGSTQPQTSASSTQTSIAFVMSSSAAPVATPNSNNFGGDVGNLNGPSSAAADLKLKSFSIPLIVAGLTIGVLL